MDEIFRPPQRKLSPATASKIDWSHPLSYGLFDCLIWHEGAIPPINLASPSIVTTRIGSPTAALTQLGPAGQTQGSNAYAIPHHGEISGAANNDLAIRVLFKPVSWSAGGFDVLFDKGSGGSRDLSVFVDNSGNLSFVVVGQNSAFGSATTAMMAGAIWDFVLTREVGVVKVYINGVLIKSVAGINTFDPVAAQLGFGYNASGGGDSGNHQFITAQVWRRALNASEVLGLYLDPFAFLVPTGEIEWPVLQVTTAAASVGAAAGTGTAQASGVASAVSQGQAAGVGAAQAIGLAGSRGAAAGIGAAQAVGVSGAVSQGTAAGIGSATGAGIAQSSAAAAGTGAASATGLSAALSQGAAAGSGAASGIAGGTFNGLAAGIGAAAAIGAALWTAQGAASGVGSALGQAAAKFTATGNAAGTGTAQATGFTVAASIGAATGIGSAAAVGTGIVTAAGNAAGVGSAASIASGTFVGIAAGVGSAQAVGSSIAVAQGAAAGIGTAQAFQFSLAPSQGMAAGFGTATAVGRAIIALPVMGVPYPSKQDYGWFKGDPPLKKRWR